MVINEDSLSLESLELETTVTLTFSAASCSFLAICCANSSSWEVSWYWSFSTALSWLRRSFCISLSGVFRTWDWLAGGCIGLAKKVPGETLFRTPNSSEIVNTQKIRFFAGNVEDVTYDTSQRSHNWAENWLKTGNISNDVEWNLISPPSTM